MGHRVDLEKQANWLAQVQSWQCSQLTVREFCRRHRLSEASFHSWRRVLRERGLLTDGDRHAMPAFVKLVAVAEPADRAIELVLGERRVVRVRAGFDAAALLQLVKLLEDAPC
jgi:transposase-like protein